jgi:hypothetical protein
MYFDKDKYKKGLKELGGPVFNDKISKLFELVKSECK